MKAAAGREGTRSHREAAYDTGGEDIWKPYGASTGERNKNMGDGVSGTAMGV